MSWDPALRVRDLSRTLLRQIFDSAPPGAINLGLGEPGLPTPAEVSLAGIAGITAGRTRYTSTAGEPDLRAAVAALYPGVVSGADDVLITVGSQEAMFAGCLALLDPGDELLYPEPGYPAYPVVAALLGARGVPYPLRPELAFRLDAADVLARITPRTRAVIYCSPSNPTGACIPRETLVELGEELERRGIPWISDEIYAAFAFDRPCVSPSELHPGGGLVLSSLSKDMAMTGWRIGWVVGPSRIMARIIAAHQYLVTCASSVSQAAALAAFGQAGSRSRRRHLALFRKRREVMREELSCIPGIRFALPEGAFYYFVDVTSHGDSIQLARRILEEQRVITIPGEAFGPSGAGYLRISFAAEEEQIRIGVRRIGELLRAGPR